MRVAVDVGGTFTDVVVLDDEGQLRLSKVETVPQDPASGVLQGLKKASADIRGIDYFIHGTTLGINALLTRSGAKVAIITTKGFRDVYDLARTDRDPLYDFKYRKPKSLVPRYWTYEVKERMGFDGKVLKAFDRKGAIRVAKLLCKEGIEAVAVCFLHSYANPAHELAMAEVLAEHCPHILVTLSHQLSREYREYERTSTAVIDAYIKPIIRTYLDKLDKGLRKMGFGGRFLMMRSGGGAMTVDTAMEQPVHLVLSGPAGGVIGAAYLSNLTGHKNLITIDMGGTSLDASLVVNGEIQVENEQRFQGLAMSIPTIDIHTIGAGGGSIAWIDDGGHLQVGPMSAGAHPGPVCYGKGGQSITFTDAAVTIGFLDPANFLGGEIHLNTNLTRQVMQQLADRLELSVEETAAGIIRISQAKIAGAVREISIERGHHPRDFALLSYGGGGAFVAADVARDLGIPTVIIPPGPANFSAFGMLMVDVVYDFAQTYVTPLLNVDLAAVREIYDGLHRRGAEALQRDGFKTKHQVFVLSAELRYVGQEHTVNIPVSVRQFGAQHVQEIVEKFNAAHLQRYGHNMTDPVEVVTFRLRAFGVLPRPTLALLAAGDGDVTRAKRSERQIYRPIQRAWVRYSVYERDRLRAGDRLAGPAIVEEPSSTTLVHTGDVLTVGQYGEMVIQIGSPE